MLAKLNLHNSGSGGKINSSGDGRAGANAAAGEGESTGEGEKVRVRRKQDFFAAHFSLYSFSSHRMTETEEKKTVRWQRRISMKHRGTMCGLP
jgi:hypothetical protein